MIAGADAAARTRRRIRETGSKVRAQSGGRLLCYEQLRRLPCPGYARSIGRRPMTTTSYESVSDAVTLVPSWNGSSHRVHRPRQAQPTNPHAAVRR